MRDEITTDLLLTAYSQGMFPMAESRDDPRIFWLDPSVRGIIPLDGLHISRSLARRIRREDYTITIDRAFARVLDGCADRPETWINDRIRALYLDLHGQGFAHSLEVWEDDGTVLAGGIYGVALGGAFFGESMFSARRNGSKLALAYLVDRLRVGGFQLFDTQFLTDHLATMGGVEIPRLAYRLRLQQALSADADFSRQPESEVSAAGLLQRNTQMS